MLIIILYVARGHVDLFDLHPFRYQTNGLNNSFGIIVMIFIDNMQLFLMIKDTYS